MNNVLQFPFKARQEAIAKEKLAEQAFESTEELVLDTLTVVSQFLKEEGNIEVLSDATVYDAILLEDAIRSLIYASMNEYYELQDTAYELYEDIVVECDCEDEQLEE